MLPNAEVVAYNLTNEEDIPRAGEATINGCKKTTPSTLKRTYTRPDGSEYVIEGGEGNGIVSDVCTRIREERKYSKYTSASPRPGECSRVWAQITTYQEYKDRYKVIYPDGHVEYTDWSSLKTKNLGTKWGYATGRRYGSSQC